MASYVDIPNTEIDHFEIDTPLVPTPLAPDLRPASPRTIDQIVGQASGTHKMDSNLINSVIKAESGFNIHAVSPKGAQGLMQLMPGTASNLGIMNPFDPKANVDGGTRYLRFLLEKYNYDLVKALAAYNAGPDRVDQYDGVPPYYETQAYVARIVRDYNRKKLAEQKATKTHASQPVTTTVKTHTTRPPNRLSTQPWPQPPGRRRGKVD